MACRRRLGPPCPLIGMFSEPGSDVRRQVVSHSQLAPPQQRGFFQRPPRSSPTRSGRSLRARKRGRAAVGLSCPFAPAGLRAGALVRPQAKIGPSAVRFTGSSIEPIAGRPVDERACRSLSETLGRHTTFLGGSRPASLPPPAVGCPVLTDPPAISQPTKTCRRSEGEAIRLQPPAQSIAAPLRPACAQRSSRH
jgi:hypothetical protein